MITKICDYAENRIKTIDNIDQLEAEELNELFNNIALDIQKNTTLTSGKRSFATLCNFFYQIFPSINTNDPQKETIKALQNAFARLR